LSCAAKIHPAGQWGALPFWKAARLSNAADVDPMLPRYSIRHLRQRRWK
jgi:hypothetical protein